MWCNYIILEYSPNVVISQIPAKYVPAKWVTYCSLVFHLRAVALKLCVFEMHTSPVPLWTHDESSYCLAVAWKSRLLLRLVWLVFSAFNISSLSPT